MTLTAASTAHTKGAWVELISATKHPSAGILLSIAHQSWPTHRNFFVDIGVGAAASEQVIIPDIWISVSVYQAIAWVLPIFRRIPKGARISARASCSTLSSTLPIGCQLMAENVLAPAINGPVAMYGGTVANSGGVQPAVLANSEGAWSQLTAATKHRHRALMLLVGKLYSDTAATAESYAMDIGIGASGSEVELLTDVPFVSTTTSDTARPHQLGPVFVDIPKGSRLSTRLRSAATWDKTQVVAYGMG
jgi:hypothetical protein